MSKELVCPFCNGELRKIHPTYVICDNCRITGEDKLWQALIDSMEEHDLCHDALVERTKELDRTRKALEIALDKLKRIQKIYTNAPFNAPINYANVCTDMYDVATEQITESQVVKQDIPELYDLGVNALKDWLKKDKENANEKM